MILGLLTRRMAQGQQDRSNEKLRGLAIAERALLLLGLVCQWAGICPIVKRVWTSSYTLYKRSGWVVLILAGFYALHLNGKDGGDGRSRWWWSE